MILDNRYKSLKTFNPYEILSLVGIQDKIDINIEDIQYKVKLSSRRLYTFKKSLICSSCGREGNIISLDLFSRGDEKQPHFNLYCQEEDKFILMTLDHVVPASKGGKNNGNNYQTMCEICNSAKGNLFLGEFKNVIDNISELSVVEKILSENNVHFHTIIQEKNSKIMYFYYHHRSGRKNRKIVAQWIRYKNQLVF